MTSRQASLLLACLLICFHARSATYSIVVYNGSSHSQLFQSAATSSCSVSPGGYTAGCTAAAGAHCTVDPGGTLPGGTFIVWFNTGGCTGIALTAGENDFWYNGSGGPLTAGTNAPTYSGDFCITNNANFSVLATPVVIGSDSSPACPNNGPQYSYSCTLSPGQVCCFPVNTNCDIQFSVYWDVWMGSGTNNPPLTSNTNTSSTSYGTNGTTTTIGLPNGSGNGNGPGPVLPTGAGSGNNTNLTGNQFYNGISSLQTVIWQGFQSLLNSPFATNGGGGSSSGGGGTGTNGLGLWSTNKNEGEYSNFGTNAGNGDVAGGDATNFLSTVIGSTNAASGSPSALSIGFVGYTLDLDPENVFPGIPSVIRTLIGWGATLWFLFWFAGAYQQTVQTMAAAELGGVPDMETMLAGFGGNVIGVASALIVPVVFIGLWVGVFSYAFNFGLERIGSMSANPFDTVVSGAGTSGQVAMYLLNDLMPLPYLLSLIWTRLTLAFTMAKLAAISAAAGRFLFGK